SSLILGYVFAELMLPMFNQLSQKQYSISFFNQIEVVLFLIIIFIISLIFAGGIPALILSRFSPHGVFHAFSKFGGKSRINSILVIGQFCLSTILISSAFIMSHQISYMLNKDLGFNKEQVVVIPIQYKHSNIYKNKISSFPQIINAAGCDRNFSNGNSTRLFITDAEKPIYANIMRIEPDYLNTLEIQLKEGRNFSNEFSNDKTNSVIVNETFVKQFDLQEPVGTILNGEMYGDERPVIVGVIKDFHFYSLRREVPPMVLHMTPEINGSWSLMVKIKPENMKKTIQQLTKTWENTVPDREFNYSFLDDNFNKKYKNEERWQKITGISTLFAFIISSLGLLGLASIIISVRTKEIGIRKV
ncbi:MAG: hypothetical protein KAR38_06595, partial [Calditrichia bacterium]|nr:hypothetical protein [Calditrichia bacterium]